MLVIIWDACPLMPHRWLADGCHRCAACPSLPARRRLTQLQPAPGHGRRHAVDWWRCTHTRRAGLRRCVRLSGPLLLPLPLPSSNSTLCCSTSITSSAQLLLPVAQHDFWASWRMHRSTAVLWRRRASECGAGGLWCHASPHPAKTAVAAANARLPARAVHPITVVGAAAWAQCCSVSCRGTAL